MSKKVKRIKTMLNIFVMKSNAKYFRWAGALICCIFVISCDYRPADVAVQFDRSAFNREKALWEAQQLTDYVFTEVYFPDYPAGNARITVAGNEAVSIEPIESEDDNTLFGETIADIYERIEKDVAYWEEQFRTNSSPYDAVNFIISYDEDYHFPKRVQFSIVEPGLMGGWYSVTVRDFVTAEAASGSRKILIWPRFGRKKSYGRSSI